MNNQLLLFIKTKASLTSLLIFSQFREISYLKDSILEFVIYTSHCILELTWMYLMISHAVRNGSFHGMSYPVHWTARIHIQLNSVCIYVLYTYICIYIHILILYILLYIYIYVGFWNKGKTTISYLELKTIFSLACSNLNMQLMFWNFYWIKQGVVFHPSEKGSTNDQKCLFSI